MYDAMRKKGGLYIIDKNKGKMKRKVVAENYLCFLALLEMVIENEQGVMITQYDMAEEFGVTIPVGYELNVNNICYSNNDNEYEYGVHLNEKY